MKSVDNEPKMQEMLAVFEGMEKRTPELAAGNLVILCADERARCLSGRYVDAAQG